MRGGKWQAKEMEVPAKVGSLLCLACEATDGEA